MIRKLKTPKRPVTLGRETALLYWQQVKNYKTTFAGMIIFIPSAAILLDTAIPYLLSMAVGTFATRDSDSMARYLWTAAAVAVLAAIANLIGFRSAIAHDSAVRRDLARDTMATLLKKDQAFFANQKIGSLTGKYIDFINGHVTLQDLFVLRSLAFGLNLIIGSVLIALHTPLVAGIVLVLIIILLTGVRIVRLLREEPRRARKELVSEVNGMAADILTNNATVQTFASEARELASFNKLNNKYRSAYMRDFRLLTAEGMGRILFMQFMQITAIALIGGMLVSGTLPLAIAIFTIAFMQRLASQLFQLGELINGYDRLFLQTTPMAEMLLEPARIVDAPHAKRLAVNAGSIEFAGATYTYEDDENPVIRDLSLAIPAGQKVGIVGHSGAGKTTITRLLLRFDNLDAGCIMIDGQDVSNVTLKSLRENIAYVSQEPLLFHRTLGENIAYAKPDASQQDIERAAEKAYALDFILSLPNGFDTVVGERGVKLSGGQRQRVAIARAILKNAPILVLDEATSALDSESEQYIQKALLELMRSRTSIVVAHRLSTIAKLDRIVVLDNGAIIEDGTHAELLTKGGIYAKLWMHQSGGFIQE